MGYPIGLIMKYILVYSSEEDKVTSFILNKLKEKNEIICISVEDILNNVEINDSIIDGNPKISWTLEDGTVVENDSETKLINRVMQIEDRFFDDFSPEDKDYAKSEFWAYLSFALSSFVYKTSSPSHLGLSGGNPSLPMQWRMVDQSEENMKVPIFFYGSKKFLPSTFLDDLTIFANPYDFHNWKPNYSKDIYRKTEPHNYSKKIMAYKRPVGEPVVAIKLGSEFILFDPKKKKTFCGKRLEGKIRKLFNIFDQEIGELLFFLEKKDEVNFGVFRNHLSGFVYKLEEFESKFSLGIFDENAY